MRSEPAAHAALEHGRDPAETGGETRPARRLGPLLPFAGVVLFVLIGLLAPLLAPYHPLAQHRGKELAPPSAVHLLGTDELGRDVFSRLLFGARTSLLVGGVSVLIGAAVGANAGLIAGYHGGLIDHVLMRLMDFLLAFPPILLGITVVAVLGVGSLKAGVAVGIASIPQFGRIARGAVLRERALEYVQAADAMGATSWRVLFRHVLPNVMTPLIVHTALAMGFAVLFEASLGFLGLGAQPPQPSWGVMLRESRAYLHRAPWYAVAAGIPIALFVLSLNSSADALRRRLDPTRRDAA